MGAEIIRNLLEPDAKLQTPSAQDLPFSFTGRVVQDDDGILGKPLSNDRKKPVATSPSPPRGTVADNDGYIVGKFSWIDRIPIEVTIRGERAKKQAVCTATYSSEPSFAQLIPPVMILERPHVKSSPFRHEVKQDRTQSATTFKDVSGRANVKAVSQVRGIGGKSRIVPVFEELT